MSLVARALGLRPPSHRIRVHGEARVPMRDGVTLRALRVGPAGGGTHPSVLIRTPYGIGWGGLWPPPIARLAARLFAQRGYHVVLQDTRGRYASDGDFYPFVHEADDGRDTLDWIEKQPWFDGNLAMWGASYFGYTQWSVAEGAPAYLRAIVPIVTTSDFYGLFYPGGAFSYISALRWATGNGERRGERPPEARLPRAALVRPRRDASRHAGRRAAFFEDWLDHPERDAYWSRVDQLGARARSRVPALLLAGSYDIFCGPQLDDYAEQRRNAWLVLGPWAHGSYALSARRLGWRQVRYAAVFADALEFFDHHLLGADAPPARVRRYVVGADRWVHEPDWPPPGAQPARLYLRAGGRLDREPPGGDEAPGRFAYDPLDPVPTRGGSFLGPRCGPDDQRQLAGRDDVLCYDSEPLARPLGIAGRVRLRLRASSDAPATDFTAKLVHLPADASRPALNLCDGIRRVAALDEAGAVEIDLWGCSAEIPAGDRLRLEVSSSNFPRYDAHPNLPDPLRATRARVARQTVHHARDAASYLELPELPA